MWRFVLLLALSHGASCIAPVSYWIQESLKCSGLRIFVDPEMIFVQTPEALDLMCKQQNEFYRCLEKMFSLGDPANLAEMHSEIGRERSVFNDLCHPDPTKRMRNLEVVSCKVNKQQIDFCFSTAVLVADDGERNYCTLREKMANCIAGILWRECSMHHALLFHHLLKLKEKISCPDSELECEENLSKTSIIEEPTDQMIKKVDPAQDQDDTEYLLLPEEVGDLHVEL